MSNAMSLFFGLHGRPVDSPSSEPWATSARRFRCSIDSVRRSGPPDSQSVDRSCVCDGTGGRGFATESASGLADSFVPLRLDVRPEVVKP